MKDRMRVLSDGTSLGMWLSQIRKAQGLTTQALAYRIGIDDGNLSRIENDRIQPTIQTIVAICDGLGIPWQQVHAVLNEPAGYRWSRESPVSAITSTMGSPDTLVVQVADVQTWVRLWYRNAPRAEQILARLYVDAHSWIVGRVRDSVPPTGLFQPGDIFRLSPLHRFEVTYPPADSDHQLARKLQIAYTRRALFMLEDVDFVMRKRQMTQDYSMGEHEVLVEAKLRTGISEKLKFGDAIELDRAFGKDGALMGMLWAAIHTRTALELVIEDVVSQSISPDFQSDPYQDMNQGVEQTRLLILSFIRLCRWTQCSVADDSIWLAHLRQEMGT